MNDQDLNASGTVKCRVYRCKKQTEMYLYLRGDLEPDDEAVPQTLRERTGLLTEVMTLELQPQRPLARVKVEVVMQALRDNGWYLQLPPPEIINAPLYWGD